MIATLFSILLLAAPLPPDGPVPGDSLAADTLALDEITVTAMRLATPSQYTPSRITVLGPDAAKRSGARSLADLLDDQSSAFLRQYGPSGLASVSLRGAGSSQSLILLDGQRISNPQLGQLDLSLLPTALMESVEVMHGPGSALYGSDAMGGVINIRTPERHGWMLSGAAGAFGERETSASVSASAGNTAGTALVEYAFTQGDFPYVDGSAFPPEARKRANADAEHLTAYTSLYHATDQHDTRLSAWYANAERGLPGTAGTASQERQHDETFRLWTSHERALSTGQVRLSGIAQHASIRYIDPASQIDQTGQTLSSHLTGEWLGQIHSDLQLSAGAEGGLQSAKHPNLQDNAQEGQMAAFALAEAQYGSLRIFPSLRADTYIRSSDEKTSLVPSPGFGANWEFARGLHAKVSGGRSFRMPTFNDRFWQPGGNRELRPEDSWSADAGLLAYRGSHRAEVSSYARHISDQIVWQPTSEGHWSPRNVQQTRTLGVEASYHVSQHLPAGFRIDGALHYAFTDARDVSNPESRSYNKPLRYVPPHHARSQVTISFGSIALDLTGRYTGRRFVTTDASQHLDSYATFDVQLRWEPIVYGARIELSGHLRNALDAEYAVLKGYPMPPRHARFRITISPQH